MDQIDKMLNRVLGRKVRCPKCGVVRQKGDFPHMAVINPPLPNRAQRRAMMKGVK